MAKRRANPITAEIDRARCRESHRRHGKALYRRHKPKINAWFAAHPGIRSRYAADRRARALAQTPETANAKIITTIYKCAKRLSDCTGIGFEVDHVIPIAKGGLHTQGNLAIIPGAINRRKNARLDFYAT